MMLNALTLTDDGVAALLVKASNPNAEFTAEESQKLYGFLYMNINTWRAIEVAYSNGMLTQMSYAAIESDITWIVQAYPALKPYMRVAVDTSSAAESDTTNAMRRALEEYR